MRFPGHDLPRSFDSIQLRHADVENHDVGVMLGHKLCGLPAVFGFRHYLEGRLLLQQEAQTGPDDGVIVGQDDADYGSSFVRAGAPSGIGIVGWPFKYPREERKRSVWRRTSACQGVPPRSLKKPCFWPAAV